MVSSPPAAAQMGEVVHDNFFAIVDVLPGAHGEVLRNCSASLQVQVHEPFWTTDDLLRVFHFMRC